MEYHRLSGFYSRRLFVTALEAGRPKAKAPAGSVPAGWLPAHGRLLSLRGLTWRERRPCVFQGTGPILGAPPS